MVPDEEALLYWSPGQICSMLLNFAQKFSKVLHKQHVGDDVELQVGTVLASARTRKGSSRSWKMEKAGLVKCIEVWPTCS